MWTKLMSSSSSKSTLSMVSSGERHQQELSMAATRRPIKPWSSLNLEEEYTKALRTKSYTDLYSKAHHQLNRSSSSAAAITPKEKNQDQEDGEDEGQRLRLAHSAPSPSPYTRYNDGRIHDFFHLEPSQESLHASTARKYPACSGRFHLHLNGLLFDFFDTTSQAGAACASLLSSIDRARHHHRLIHHLLARLTTASQHSQLSAFSELSSQLKIDNPLSPQNLSHFHHIHSLCPALIRRLASARHKISRRLKIIKFTKKASGMAVVAILGAAVVAAVVIATHAAVAIAAAPLATLAAGRVRGVGRWFKGWMRLERAKVRVDAAAKGAYIVGKDLDTMSRMVRRVHDEVEHGRDVARMVVGNRECVMVKEVVKEMEGRGGEVGLGFEGHLEELEEHVYLCLITINRSRMLVAQGMLEGLDQEAREMV